MKTIFSIACMAIGFIAATAHASDTKEQQLEKLRKKAEDVDAHAKDFLLAAYTRPQNDSPKTARIDGRYTEQKRQIIKKLYKEEEELRAELRRNWSRYEELATMQKRKADAQQQSTLNLETQLKVSRLHRRVRAKL